MKWVYFARTNSHMSGDYFVHASSFVGQGAVIGKGTRIWHFCHIMGTAVLGENCNLGQNVYIDGHVVIGNGVKIQNNVSVYKGVVVEDDVFLGPSMVFTNVINPRSFIERKTEFRVTVLRKGSTVGANATILCGIEVGAYALIGAGAMVIRDVPAYGLVVGNPARQVGWVSRSGLRLQFDEHGQCTVAEEGLTYVLDNGQVTCMA